MSALQVSTSASPSSGRYIQVQQILPQKCNLQSYNKIPLITIRLHLKCDGTRAETRFRLSGKRTSPFKSAGASVQSTAGSRGVRISCSNAGYTMFRGSVKRCEWGLATHAIRQFPLHFPSRASPCAITFQLDSTKYIHKYISQLQTSTQRSAMAQNANQNTHGYCAGMDTIKSDVAVYWQWEMRTVVGDSVH